MARNELHVVMLPWSAFGHMMPFFQLAIALARAGVRVSFIPTPTNIQRLPKIPPNLASMITLVALPLPELDYGGLPKGAEATVDIPFEKIPHLKNAYDLLQYPFEKFVANQSPNWTIIDVIPQWVVEIAQKHQVPLMFFSVFSAATQVFLGPPKYLSGEGRARIRPSMESLMSKPDWVTFPSSLAFKKHEADANFGALYGPNVTEMPEAERIAKILKNCRAVSIRTCNEYDGIYIDLLRKILGKPVIPAGLLPPEKLKEKEMVTNASWKKIFKWLDERKPKSGVFVGLGSECKFYKDQIYEMAFGLELAEVPFLWALRKTHLAKRSNRC